MDATSTPEKRIPKHGKGKHNHVGKDILFEFACAKDSNLGEVGHKNGVRVIRLCKEDINLEDPHSIEQLIAQVGAPKGCSIHGFHRMQAMESMATLKPDEVSQAGGKDQSRTRRKALHWWNNLSG